MRLCLERKKSTKGRRADKKKENRSTSSMSTSGPIASTKVKTGNGYSALKLTLHLMHNQTPATNFEIKSEGRFAKSHQVKRMGLFLPTYLGFWLKRFYRKKKQNKKTEEASDENGNKSILSVSTSEPVASKEKTGNVYSVLKLTLHLMYKQTPATIFEEKSPGVFAQSHQVKRMGLDCNVPSLPNKNHIAYKNLNDEKQEACA